MRLGNVAEIKVIESYLRVQLICLVVFLILERFGALLFQCADLARFLQRND